MKLRTGYKDYPADALAHLGKAVATNLPTIAHLATVKPTAAQIDTAADNLGSALAMVGLGRAEAIASALTILAGLLAELATNAPQLVGVTDIDLAEIGLPEVRTPVRTTTPPPACQDLRLSHGSGPGEVKGKCKSLGDTIRVYEGQHALDANNGPWSEPIVFTDSRSFLFTGLERGKDTWFRVRARNAIGAGPWSDPATIMVT